MSMSDLGWVDDLAVETFNEKTLAGLALGIVRNGELARFVGLGLADGATGRRIDEDTVFRIGSLSKTMTAIGVMQLVEEGRVALDDDVNEHLRSFRIEPADPREPITLRHLLTHTGGLGELRGWSDLFRPTIGLAAKIGEAPPLRDYYADGLQAEVRPSTKWAYANHGFAALGQLVADVSGEPFAERMRSRVFEPLGMQATDFRRTEPAADALAVGYQLKRGRMRPVKDREIVVSAAGSVFSTVADLARYAAAIAGGGSNVHGRVLERETFEEMLTPQYGDEGIPAAMGLAFMLEDMDGHRVAGHDGGWPGFISSLLVAPDDGLAVVALTNTSTAIAPHDLAERVLHRLLGIEEARPRQVAQSPHLWPELTGIYKPLPGLNTNLRIWPLLGGEVEVLVGAGHLTVRAPSPVRTIRKGMRLHAADAEDPLAFEIREEELILPVQFGRGPDGRIDRIAAGSTRAGWLTLYRRPRATSLGLWARAAAGAGALSAILTGVRRLQRRRHAGA